MNEKDLNYPITIAATNRNVLVQALNHAVKLTQEIAMAEGRRGILVTHEAPCRFTVALHDDVPFGLTTEKRTW